MMNIIQAIRVAKEYYDIDTYYHVMRVAAYVANDNTIPEDKREKCVILAIMHDLREDTGFNYYMDCCAEYDSYIDKCIDLLTKDKEASYEYYLDSIKRSYNSYPEVYWVKMADMKDHLSERETLTDELKEKYLKALPCLL